MVWSRVRSNKLSRYMARLMSCAGTGALVLGLALPVALAQQVQPKTSAAPKSQPAAPSAQAPAGTAPVTGTAGDAAAGGSPEDAWVKLCMKSEQTQNKEICLTNHEGLEPNTGMVLIAAAVRKVEGEDKQQRSE